MQTQTMQTNWRDEAPQLLVIGGMFLAAAVLWSAAPDRIPVHWNIAGEVDRYGGKFEGLLLMPLVALCVYLLLLLLPRIDPKRANYGSFWTAYALIRFSVLFLLATVYACILLVAFGYQVDVGLLVPLGVGTLLCILGSLMGKIRPNWFVGVRTPWTLSSRASWNKTHRLAGPLFILLGIAIAACGFVRTYWMFGLAVGTGVVVIVWLTIYSYRVWRDDPERSRNADAAASAE